MDKGRALLRAGRLGMDALRFHFAPILGSRSKFAIDPGYRHRKEVSYFDDTDNSDEWQLEVYEWTGKLMRANNLRSVHDIGCGSAYKLIKILGEFETTGVDLVETIKEVKQRYPDRTWIAGDFAEIRLKAADVVVCSDVIEHVKDPEELMHFVISSTKDWVVLSTPARELLYDDRQRLRFGPPENPTHLREWTTAEFRNFAESYLQIERHVISNLTQGTQMIVGRKRLGRTDVDE